MSVTTHLWVTDAQAFWERKNSLGHFPIRGKAVPVCPWEDEDLGSCGCAVEAVLTPSSSQESVPVSSYQHAGIPLDVKRKIARLGINMLLKMVSSQRGAHPPPCLVLDLRELAVTLEAFPRVAW